MDNSEKIEHSHTDLNLFAGIVALLEGGTVYTRSGHVAAARITKICHAEQSRQIKVYDRAKRIAASKKGTP